VRQEVEDHLWEAVAAEPSGNTLQAQQRAIANFGDARAIAAQFAVVSLATHTRRAGVAAVLVIAGDLIAMKARVAWYAAAQWGISDDMKALRGLVILIDRYAFWMSVIIGLGALAYIFSREIPAAFYPAYRRQLRCFSLLCSATAAALVVSVVSDGVADGAAIAGNGAVGGNLGRDRHDGDRDRMRRVPRLPHPQQHAAGGIHGGLAENVTANGSWRRLSSRQKIRHDRAISPRRFRQDSGG
jgi:hypothetical protein